MFEEAPKHCNERLPVSKPDPPHTTSAYLPYEIQIQLHTHHSDGIDVDLRSLDGWRDYRAEQMVMLFVKMKKRWHRVCNFTNYQISGKKILQHKKRLDCHYNPGAKLRPIAYAFNRFLLDPSASIIPFMMVGAGSSGSGL